MKKSKIVITVFVLVVVVAVIVIIATASPQVAPLQPVEQSTAVPTRGYELASPPGDRSIVVTLVPQNNSLEQGHAAFRDMGEKVQVTIEFTKGFPAGAIQPAHIHTGTCKQYGAIVYDLPSVTNGVSDTTLDSAVDGLVARFPLIINVHKSAQEIGTIVACAPLVRF